MLDWLWFFGDIMGDGKLDENNELLWIEVDGLCFCIVEVVVVLLFFNIFVLVVGNCDCIKDWIKWIYFRGWLNVFCRWFISKIW